MAFIETPNIPEEDAALVAVSGTYPKIIDALHSLGIQTVSVRRCRRLSNPVASHADMLMHHLGGNQIVVEKGETYLIGELQQYGFTVTQSNICVSDVYPKDIALNAARVGNRLFAKSTDLDKTITEYCEKQRIEIIPVKQGYTKCSTVVVNENSIITEDPSIANAAKAKGMDVLSVMPGSVMLDGYDYGFLGGTCGMIGKNKLAFAGSVQFHPDSIKIIDFCSRKKVELISLTDGPLMDIGGILPLKVKR